MKLKWFNIEYLYFFRKSLERLERLENNKVYTLQSSQTMNYQYEFRVGYLYN